MSPDAADPRVQDRIAAGTQVLDRAREIYGELCTVLDDLDRVVATWSDVQREGGGPDAQRG